MTTTLRKMAPDTAEGTRPGTTVTLSRYAVLVDGVEVGQVFQHRAQTMQSYGGGSRLGYPTARTAWAWESTEDNMGDYEIETRREALDDLLSMVDVEGVAR